MAKIRNLSFLSIDDAGTRKIVLALKDGDDVRLFEHGATIAEGFVPSAQMLDEATVLGRFEDVVRSNMDAYLSVVACAESLSAFGTVMAIHELKSMRAEDEKGPFDPDRAEWAVKAVAGSEAACREVADRMFGILAA